MNDREGTDAWDQAARRAAGRDALVRVASEFLAKRQDQALGLAPAKFLPAATAPLWILYWCAARRVDDSIEGQRTDPRQWLQRASKPGGNTLAERCMDELRRIPALQDANLDALLARSLEGIERERWFDRPRPWSAYVALLDLKSTPTMEVFDALLAPDEDAAVRTAHARAFARSAQIGDDCRDALNDLGSGRCFITLEELGEHQDPEVFARMQRFAQRRAELCRSSLQEAEGIASRFRSGDVRQRAAGLHQMWRDAIESGQVRPTAQPLALPR